MSYKHYERFLHLNRPGEVSTRDRQALEEHLEKCPTCAGEWQRIMAFESRLESLRRDVPSLSRPQEMTATIMATIQSESHQQGQPVIAALNWLFGASFPRRAAAVVCFGMICLFLGQHLSMLREVRGLERRLAKTPHAAAGFNLNYIFPAEAWEELEQDFGNGVTREVLARFIQRKENRVLLARRPLRSLLAKYRHRQTQKVLVAVKLLEQHPGLKEKIEPLLKSKAPPLRPWFNLQQHRSKQP